MAKKLTAIQMELAVRLALLAPVLLILGALSVADFPVAGSVVLGLGLALLVFAVYRLWSNERTVKRTR